MTTTPPASAGSPADDPSSPRQLAAPETHETELPARLTGALADPAIGALVAGEHANPHSVLGAHPAGEGWLVRCYRPAATAVEVLLEDGRRVPAERVHPAGVFEAIIPGASKTPPVYRYDVHYGDKVFPVEDPYRFLPTLGDKDLYFISEGTHRQLWRVLGSRVMTHQGVAGTAFSVWAPTARSVRVVGDWNGWDGRIHPMRSMGSSGVWELFVPGVGAGAHYKYEILSAEHHLLLKADPLARRCETPPKTASIVWESDYGWGDEDWLRRRRTSTSLNQPLSIYEVHLESWRRGADGEVLDYRELAKQLSEYVSEMGFTHVELLPVAEHPFGGSWGYQVTGYYAPTSRFGSPDDFKHFVDTLHAKGIGVIVDWVPAHFPRDDWALAHFDGSSLYEHADPRQGEHPDWGTKVFNFGRNEVRNFLTANALFWVEEYHIDGLRVDAVASMVYLDYSRKEGEWIPNRYGGKENLDAVAFLHEVNTVLHAEYPGVMCIAEESTAWSAVSRPVHLGGLGFTHKWNMGWMHDTLLYFSKDPLFRRYHHNELTFGLLYAFHENFVLPLSHDEVVHGKGSLLSKMPGDRWQQLANLRSLFAWMWAHPGKQLLFMGGEIGQEREWYHGESIDWHVLEWRDHQGLQELVKAVNRVQRDEPALWERDFEGSGFHWIDANDVDNSVYSFLRYSGDGSRVVACLANLTPSPRDHYRVGLPRPGRWEVILDTDSSYFAGSDYAKVGEYWTDPQPWHGYEQSVDVRLPPLAVVWLRWLP